MERAIEQTKVVVVGAGFGGLHAAFALRQQLPSVGITVVAPAAEFTYRPGTIYLPFGAALEDLILDLEGPLKTHGIQFVQGKVSDIDVFQRRVTVAGHQLPFDYLVIAWGASLAVDRVPGLSEHSYHVGSIPDLVRLRSAFADLPEPPRDRGPEPVSWPLGAWVLFLTPPGTLFPGPLYELALLLDTWLSRHGRRSGVGLTLATWEPALLGDLGPGLDDSLAARFRQHHIDVRTEAVVHQVGAHEVEFEGGVVLPYDVLITQHAPVGALHVEGLNYDPSGLVRTDVWTRRAEGQHAIFVVGDAAADQTIKQAYMAFAQADVAVHHIRCNLTGDVPRRFYEPRSRYILDDGVEGVYIDSTLRHGLPNIATAWTWRLSKRLLGRYLSWKIGRGKPLADILHPGPVAVYSH